MWHTYYGSKCDTDRSEVCNQIAVYLFACLFVFVWLAFVDCFNTEICFFNAKLVFRKK